MGMFDSPPRWDETFEKGQYFTLLDAKLGNEIETEYGKGIPANLKIRTEDGDRWFSVFGQALNSQIEQMEEGELRGGVEVAIVDKTNKAGTQDYKVLATREQIENDDIPF